MIDTPDYLGTGTGGDLTRFSMYFAVDFDASANQISSGTLDLDVGYYETWETTFTGGTINGALAEFVGINGNFGDYYGTPTSVCAACVTGEIRGVFTGTLDAATNNGGGFVAGFSLNNGLGDSVIGLGLLDGTDILD